MAILKLNAPDGFLEEEPKTLVVSSKTKHLWLVLLDLLAEFDRVCKAYGIRYFADAGTILGAVRHKGMIPWDDDIDVILFRDEYERLCKIAPQTFKDPYFFQTNDTDPGSCRGHAQLRNSSTTGILKSEMINGRAKFKFNQGIFIDIFVMDNVPDDDDELVHFCSMLFEKKKKIWLYKELCALQFCPCDIFHPAKLRKYIRGMFIRFCDWFRSCKKRDLLEKDLNLFAQKYNSLSTKRCAPVSFRPVRKKGEFFNKNIFDDSVTMDFEFIKIPVPVGWREMLEGRYGDWHQHVIGASTHGGLLIDTDRPYTEYLK